MVGPMRHAEIAKQKSPVGEAVAHVHKTIIIQIITSLGKNFFLSRKDLPTPEKCSVDVENILSGIECVGDIDNDDRAWAPVDHINDSPPKVVQREESVNHEESSRVALDAVASEKAATVAVIVASGNREKIFVQASVASGVEEMKRRTSLGHRNPRKPGGVQMAQLVHIAGVVEGKLIFDKRNVKRAH